VAKPPRGSAAVPGHQQQALKSAVQNLVQTWIHALIEYAKIRLRLPPSTPAHSSYENEQ
jgi:hypothetical protein